MKGRSNLKVVRTGEALRGALGEVLPELAELLTEVHPQTRAEFAIITAEAVRRAIRRRAGIVRIPAADYIGKELARFWDFFSKTTFNERDTQFIKKTVEDLLGGIEFFHNPDHTADYYFDEKFNLLLIDAASTFLASMDEESTLEAARDILGRLFPNKDVEEALEYLTAKEAARRNPAGAMGETRPEQLHDAAEETTGRATEPPRPDEITPVAAPEPAPSIEDAATETTKPEKPHWKDVRQPGEELADFIARVFAPELADGTMTRQTLNRYRGLYQDFYNHRAKMPPELQSIPTKSRALDRQVVEGKMTDAESIRSAERDRKRVAAAYRRAI